MYKSNKIIKALICIATILTIIFCGIKFNGVFADEGEEENTETSGEVIQEESGDTEEEQSGEELLDASEAESTSVCRVVIYDNNNEIDSYEYYDSLEEAVTHMGYFARALEIIVENVEISDTLTLSNSSYEIRSSPDLINEGKVATITRASGFTGTMISNPGTLVVSDVVLDGGWSSDHSGIVATGPIINAQAAITFNNVTLQNNYNTSSDGGGAICSTASITANSGTTIENCASTYAGAFKGTGIIANDLTINSCYSTNTAGNAASAIYIINGWPGLEVHNLEVTNCVAVNAEECGAAIYVESGAATYFGTESNQTCNLNISNNYSHGTYSGFYQGPNWTYIAIYDDITINGNKSGCTIDNSWNVTSTGSESNFNINNPNPIYFNTDVTSSSNVGITVIGATPVDGKVNFASLNGHSGVGNGYHSDIDQSAAIENNGMAAIGEGQVVPPGTIQVTIKIAQNENSGVGHTYQVLEDWSTEVVATTTQTGTTDTSNCISFTAEAGHSYRIILDGGWSNDYNEVDISGEMAQGVTTPTEDNGNIFYVNFQVNSNATANTTSVIIYDFITETPPDTGVKENIAVIIIFITIISVYGIILIKME